MPLPKRDSFRQHSVSAPRTDPRRGRCTGGKNWTCPYWLDADAPPRQNRTPRGKSLASRLAAFLLMLWASSAIAAAAEPVDFDTQVVPILTRQGCNAGACHGAAAGRGGLKLSLFGSSPMEDHRAIVRALEGRRVNLADPDASLLLRKPSGRTAHEGGLRLSEGSGAYGLMRRWIDEGARRTCRRHLTRLVVSPKNPLLTGTGQSITPSVVAHFDNGQKEDVTEWVVFSSGDPDAVEIDPKTNRLTATRPGSHVVVARYLDQVRAIRLDVPWNPQPPNGDPPPAVSFIDRHVNAQLERLHVPASAQADDAEFVRRIWLDLAGRLPPPQAARRFVTDESDDKRERLIDRLLASEDFVDYWALQWAGVLSIDAGQLQPEGAAAYHRWIAERLREDAPFDETARQLLTAVGDSYRHGAANFTRSASGPREHAEYATRVFMAVRLRCANCHDHPLDHWQQDDYHGLAAIFAKLQRGRVVTLNERGRVTHPVTGEPAVPRIPGERDLAPSVDGRVEFARWLTADDNPSLARATVNRIWQQLTGRGLVDPVDDLRATNPATHPALLEELAEQFVADGFRFKPMIRRICRSATYQRSSTALEANRTDTRLYSHALRRPLPAAVIADAIGDVTGVPLEIIGRVPPDASGDAQPTRAIELTNNRLPSLSLDLLGRCDRSGGCESSAGDDAPSLARSLHLLNGDLLNSRLASPSGRLAKLLERQPDDAAVIDQLYWLTLSRPPSEAEQRYWIDQGRSLDDAPPVARQHFFEDMLWSLMTSQSFLTNH